ncbi:tRNA (5-methylaminomethyl-2-thiouridine)(34)-methyltransferase MnmD [Chryseobacterium sp. POL2]|uniref:tRNA (5-methylaminomethyl-2-thiouridine)(34)-methyltransferase MnmD n=1 Tax=Chryseobacterium sp. POL2 TaxID=2713414 RepID=UPI0016250FBE|nr:tRNA (5-methylaminomethyl-2-thiouridine)(34)-methyltransferase MnmD [Chryseobacterium sp. POL2]
MINREIITTKDGSKTLYINNLNESYHSQYGALQEAEHVFINNGFIKINNYQINILELGLGTGLNLLVTINELLKNDKNHIIHYFGIEKYPVNESEIEVLSYAKHFKNPEIALLEKKIHAAAWNEMIEITPNFYLTKIKADFFDIKNLELPPIDLVYFDCFGAKVQPDLWEKDLFEIVADKMRINGLLTTYSSKGSVRRCLQELNFEVQKLAGPPGKREMLNAIKLS